MTTSCLEYCVDYDDGGGAFGYCDNIDQQRIEDAINSHNPADGYVEQAPIGV